MTMITDRNRNPVLRPLVMTCSVIALLSACEETKTSCEVPRHWLSNSEPNPDLTPKSLVTLNAARDLQLNGRTMDIEAIRKAFNRISRFDRSELIEVRISSRLPCDEVEAVIDLIDKSADCKKSTYCRVRFAD